ncbi:MAG TPA: hypothetical protein VM165_12635 [Planctomycetaceae bacterium]|nr:hypothetical protein [Planctomycetaceae bacterium]
MSTTIKVDVQNNAGAGLRDVVKELDRVDNSAHKAGAELKQAAKAAKSVGDTSGGFSKLGLGVIGLNQGLQLLTKGAQVAGMAVSAAAEDGSPAFQGLMESVTGVQNSLLDLADDPAVQDMIAGMPTSITDTLIPAIQSIPDVWREFNNDASRTFSYLGEAVGIFAEGTLEANEDIIASNAKVTEQQKEQIAAERERIAVDEKLGKIRDKLQADLELSNIANIQHEQTLIDLIGDEEDSLREMVQSGERDKTKQEAAFKRIEVAERALLDLPKKRADKHNAETEKIIQKIDAEKAHWKSLMDSMAEAGKAVRDQADSAKQSAADKATADLRKTIAEAKSMKMSMGGAGGGAAGGAGGSLVDSITGQFSDKTVKQAFVKNKADAAEAKARADSRTKYTANSWPLHFCQ